MSITSAGNSSGDETEDAGAVVAAGVDAAAALEVDAEGAPGVGGFVAAAGVAGTDFVLFCDCFARMSIVLDGL